MSRLSLKEVLIQRDGLEEWEAEDEIRVAREEFDEILDEEDSLQAAEEFIKDRFGLEPDYLDDLFPL